MPSSAGVTSIPILKVDGSAVGDALTRLVELRVTRSLSAVSHVRIRLDDIDDEAAGVFPVGKPLEVIALDANAVDQTIFKGEIVSVGIEFRFGRNEFIVDAYDVGYKLARTTIIKSNVDSSTKDIISAIAGEVGLSPHIDGSMARIKSEATIQQFGTAHRFLSEFCRTAGYEWQVDDGELKVGPRSTSGATTTVTGGEDLVQFDARFTSMDQASKVSVRGWDAKTKEAVVGEYTPKNMGAESASISMVADQKRKSDVTTWPRHVVGKDDAKLVAEGIGKRMDSMAVRARGVTEVNPAIKPGSRIEVKNVGAKWSGEYYISGVEHVFGDDQTFVTRFSTDSLESTSLVELLGRGEESNTSRFASGLTIGIVTNNKDPDGHGNRVKVKLPYLSEEDESEWARLVQPGAGKERGLLMLPEIDDEVLVGFEEGDIRRPLILGGLWNGKDKPPIPSTDKGLLDGGAVTSRSLTSRNGHRLTLADKGPDGDYVEIKLGDEKAQLWLGDERIDLILNDDLPITVKSDTAELSFAKGGDITMKGKKITIEATDDLTLKGKNIKTTSQMNTEMSASMNFSAKGQAGVKVESSAIAEVKGTMVKIN